MPARVLRELEELPTPIVARIRKLVERLKRWPDVSGVKQLKGALAGSYRLRTVAIEGDDNGRYAAATQAAEFH